MLIRIPISDKNATISPVYESLKPDSGDSDGGNSDSGAFSLPSPVPFLTAASIPQYTYSRYPNPTAPLNVSVPDDDRQVIAAWLGNTTSTPVAPSDTLVKRMTQAVHSVMDTYFTDAARLNIFISPFRIALALRLADGSHKAISTPALVSPNTMAPLMVIHEAETAGSILKTQTEIVNSPMKLTVTVPTIELPEELAAQATHLDIIATRQTPLTDGKESVTAIRSYYVRGTSLPCWHYTRIAEDIIRAAALADNEFRVLASLPVSGATAGGTSVSLPDGDTPLSDWESFPKVSTESIPDTPDPGTPAVTGYHLLTEPLDLDLPERYKRIRGVTLRGIFPRPPYGEAEDVPRLKLTLYGSHHRERWHKIAVALGPHIRLLRKTRYRWLRVEADIRLQPATTETPRFDAITFIVV